MLCNVVREMKNTRRFMVSEAYTLAMELVYMFVNSCYVCFASTHAGFPISRYLREPKVEKSEFI